MATAAELDVRMRIIGAQAARKELQRFDSDLKRTSRSAQAASGRMSRLGKSGLGLAAGLGIGTIGVAGLGLALKGTIGNALSFEKQLAEVNTLIGLSGQEYEAFGDQARALSDDIGIMPNEVLPALYQAISAGIPRQNVFEFLDVAGRAAIGGVTDLKTAVSGIGTIVNAFKVPVREAGDVADAMFTAVRLGVTTMGELSNAMSIGAPIASNLGVSYDELLSSVATLTKQGFSTAEAMTAIRGAMVGILRSQGGKINELFQKYGFVTGEAALKTLGFQKTLAVLRQEVGDDSAKLVELIGRVEGVNAVLGLTGRNAETAADDLEQFGDKVGAANDAFEIMEKTGARTFQRLKVELSLLAEEIGRELLPALLGITEGFRAIMGPISGVLQANRDLNEAFDKLIKPIVEQVHWANKSHEEWVVYRDKIIAARIATDSIAGAMRDSGVKLSDLTAITLTAKIAQELHAGALRDLVPPMSDAQKAAAVMTGEMVGLTAAINAVNLQPGIDEIDRIKNQMIEATDAGLAMALAIRDLGGPGFAAGDVSPAQIAAGATSQVTIADARRAKRAMALRAEMDARLAGVGGGGAAPGPDLAAERAEKQIRFAEKYEKSWTSAFRRVTEAQRALSQARRGDIVEADRVNAARRQLIGIEEEIAGLTKPKTDRERHLRIQLRGMDIEETKKALSEATGRDALELELQLVAMQAQQIRDQKSGDVEQAERNLENHQKSLEQEIERRKAVVDSRQLELTWVESTIALALVGDEKILTNLQTRVRLTEKIEEVERRIAEIKGAAATALEAHQRRIASAPAVARLLPAPPTAIVPPPTQGVPAARVVAAPAHDPATTDVIVLELNGVELARAVDTVMVRQNRRDRGTGIDVNIH